MRGLAARGERFDTLIFADSLEHLRDPFEALEAAAEIATPGAVLIVSVPNAASVPVVSDLLRGRFDPVAAGPEDVGHLRWFTRRSLEELLVETGYADVRCDPVPVPSDDGLTARLAAAGIAVDRNALGAIQWIATARRRGRR
jgi:SAM-dependent methyltransferase